MSLSFLLASWTGPGNLSPLLTAARRLARKGHKVRIIGGADIREDTERCGFPFTCWQSVPTYTDRDNTAAAAESSEFQMICEQVLFGPAAAYAADTMKAFRQEPTDALLSHDLLIGPTIAAEAAAIPCALLSPHVSLRPLPGVPPAISGMMPPTNAEERAKLKEFQDHLSDGLNEWLPTLNRARAGFGLDPLGHFFDHYDRVDRVLLAMSPAFDFPADRLPDNVRYIGPLLDPPAWSRPWKAPWSSGPRRPRVLVSFSTTFQGQTEMLQRTISALGDLALDAVVTTGPAMAEEELSAPPNVALVHSAPHDAVMPEVSLVITHGGHGTVTRSLVHGVPLLVVPTGRDQSDNAARVVARGAGLSLTESADKQEIVAAITRLISEPHFAATARRMGERIAPDLESNAVVTEMEAIVMPQLRRSA